MDWIEVSVSTNTLASDAVSQALIGSGAKGTQIIDRADVPGADEGPGYGELYGSDLVDYLPLDVRVLAWFSSIEEVRAARAALSELARVAGFDTGSLSMHTKTVEEEDWAENWKQYYKPLRVGKRLVIRPEWEAYTAGADDLVITMDPGMAFGTGTHETTRLCLALIEQTLQTGDEVLDVGTGSGILGIAAALLGAKAVTAVDLDPVAVKAAQENAIRNGLSDVIRVIHGDLAQDVTGQFDLVCANIIADVIILLLPQVGRLCKDKARLVLSGIIRDREADVRHHLAQHSYQVADALYEGEWVALLAVPGGQA